MLARTATSTASSRSSRYTAPTVAPPPPPPDPGGTYDVLLRADGSSAVRLCGYLGILRLGGE